MSIQRVFSLFICIIALFGIIGSGNLPLFTVGNISDGFAPLLYSLILFVSGVVLFFSGKTKEKFNIREWLLEGAHGKAFVFFLLNILLLILLVIFGPFISMLVFSVLAGFALKRQTPRNMVLFSVVYTIFVYLIFVVILKMPFDRGFIFDLMLGYI
jgi:hypothetical protein